MNRHRPTDDATGDQAARRRWPRVDPASVLQAISLLVTITLVVFLVGYVADQRAQLACQAQVNREFRDALRARSETAATDRAAVRQLLVETVGQQNTSAQDREALDRYLDTAEQLAAASPALPTVETRC